MERKAALLREFIRVHSRRVQQALRDPERPAVLGVCDLDRESLDPHMEVFFASRERVISLQNPDSPHLRWCVAQMESCSSTECVIGLVFSRDDMLSFKLQLGTK